MRCKDCKYSERIIAAESFYVYCSRFEKEMSAEREFKVCQYMESDEYRMEKAIELTTKNKTLEEKVEQTKGCEFCDFVDDGCIYYAGCSKQVAVDAFHENEVDKINYCPMCGRKL